MKKSPFRAFIILTLGTISGCLPYLYHEREPALIDGINIDETLKVARDELAQGGGFSVLTIWAIRDQIIDEAQAREISNLYFRYIDTIDSSESRHRKFGVWHFTWAISNLYRFGDERVKKVLHTAYTDAKKRVKTLDRSYAEKHVLGEQIYTGLAHLGGRAYARKHLVVPGNEDFLQSYAQYLKGRE